MKRVLVLFSVITLTGCPTPVPLIKEAPKCDISSVSELLTTCAGPAAIRPGITFGEMIEVARRDRDSLQACAAKHRSLSDTISACNRAIDGYNAEIRKINAQSGNKP